MKYRKKVAIVTGGAQGIGKAITKFFLENNVTVVITDIDKKAGHETVKEFSALGDIFFIPTNNARQQDVQRTVNSTIKKYQRLDILINNAGTFKEKSFEKLSLDEWNNIIGTNLTGMIHSIFRFTKLILI